MSGAYRLLPQAQQDVEDLVYVIAADDFETALRVEQELYGVAHLRSYGLLFGGQEVTELAQAEYDVFISNEVMKAMELQKPILAVLIDDARREGAVRYALGAIHYIDGRNRSTSDVRKPSACISNPSMMTQRFSRRPRSS